jgi:coiled-coil and C2 domain-containing protein 2A
LEIKTPAILLGYTKTPETGLPDMRELTHISLFISLEPTFEVPKLLTSGLECIELDPTKVRIVK